MWLGPAVALATALTSLCEHGLMPTDPTGTGTLSIRRRWATVVVSLLVTASAFVFINGVAFLIPALEDDLGTPLAEAGLLSSMPSFGMVATLILWGWLLDRVGERIVLTVGSALTAVAAYGATTAHSLVAFGAWLFVGGMAAASCNSAGGRLVSGWFPPSSAGWRWASGRPRNRWELLWARWSSRYSPSTPGPRRRA